jgi:hypothetical protein
MGRYSLGPLTIEVTERRSDHQQQHWTDFEIEPADPVNMVLIGGGVVGDENPGGYLTASYPNVHRTAWLVSTKDHIHADPHYITGYAISMSIDEVDVEDLRKVVQVFEDTSEIVPHPSARARAPDGYRALGGGFKVHYSGAGNIATASVPDSYENQDTWFAASKDHGIDDPGAITAYVVTIPEYLEFPYIAQSTLKFFVHANQSPGTEGQKEAHPHAEDWKLPDNYLLTGGGAIAKYDDSLGDAGSLLWKLQPLEPTGGGNRLGWAGASKDLDWSFPTTVVAVSCGIYLEKGQ